MLHQILKEGKFPSGVIITFQVMAFTRMSAGYPDTVCTFPQGGQKEFGAHPSGAGNPYDPDIGRVFHSADAGKIGRAIAAPVAQKSHNFWFPIRHFDPHTDIRSWIIVSKAHCLRSIQQTIFYLKVDEGFWSIRLHLRDLRGLF